MLNLFKLLNIRDLPRVQDRVAVFQEAVHNVNIVSALREWKTWKNQSNFCLSLSAMHLQLRNFQAGIRAYGNTEVSGGLPELEYLGILNIGTS